MSLKLAAPICAVLFLVTLNAAHACENDFARLDADFEGARMSECVAKKHSFNIRIDPENTPINPSPWYAFRVTPKQPGELKIVIRYSDSSHRYRPKRSDDATVWRLIDEKRVRERRKGKKVTLRLETEDEPFFVAGQELLVAGTYQKWTDRLVEAASLRTEIIGASVEGRPLVAIYSDPKPGAEKKEHVLFLGRQHPPELTGSIAMLSFLETVFADTALARQFRDRFHITAIPLMNPDGVKNGNWRHNTNGVDLNRDWGPFTQPETQAVKRIADAIANDKDGELRLMLDFHSTSRNVFYTQFRDVETIPPKYTRDWLAAANARLKGRAFERAERHQTELPTSKNYFHGRFGAPAITYELGDQTDRRLIRGSSIIFAEEMMETLLASDPSLADKASPPNSE